MLIWPSPVREPTGSAGNPRVNRRSGGPVGRPTLARRSSRGHQAGDRGSPLTQVSSACIFFGLEPRNRLGGRRDKLPVHPISGSSDSRCRFTCGRRAPVRDRHRLRSSAGGWRAQRTFELTGNRPRPTPRLSGAGLLSGPGRGGTVTTGRRKGGYLPRGDGSACPGPRPWQCWR